MLPPASSRLNIGLQENSEGGEDSGKIHNAEPSECSGETDELPKCLEYEAATTRSIQAAEALSRSKWNFQDILKMSLVVDSEGTLTFDLPKILGQWFLRSECFSSWSSCSSACQVKVYCSYSTCAEGNGVHKCAWDLLGRSLVPQREVIGIKHTLFVFRCQEISEEGQRKELSHKGLHSSSVMKAVSND